MQLQFSGGATASLSYFPSTIPQEYLETRHNRFLPDPLMFNLYTSINTSVSFHGHNPAPDRTSFNKDKGQVGAGFNSVVPDKELQTYR